MTSTAQSAALAKHLRLDRQFVLMKRSYYYRVNAQGYTDQLSEAWKVSEAVAKEHVYPHDEPVTMRPAPLPDWAGDLNAIQAVWLGLPWDKQCAAALKLHEVCGSNQLNHVVAASAAERLEAILRTLNLWDSPC